MRRFLALLAIVAVAGGVVAARQPTQPSSQPFFFIQLTDPQFGMFTDNREWSQEAANLEFAVATANRLRPAFVVVTGDLVNRRGDRAQIDAYRRVLRRLHRSIPLYSVPGNHDIDNEPTPATLAAYRRAVGPDHFAFRHGSLAGIVLNSCLMARPDKATDQAAAQDRWLRDALSRARASGAQHTVVFQHHPPFLQTVDEKDAYDNLPRDRRARYLALFHEFGVRHVFAGHYHQNAMARDGDLEIVTTGPIGKPLRGAKSGLRIAVVSSGGLDHRYYELGDLPATVTLPKDTGSVGGGARGACERVTLFSLTD